MLNNKNLFVVAFAMICLFGLAFMGSVKAYDEPAFGNEECVTDMSWLDKAKTDYQFDDQNGKFTTSGETVNEYRQPTGTKDAKFVFYDVSSDGKTLIAYVPSYSSTVGSDITNKYVSEAGISTEYTCTDVIKVTKTVTGEAPSDPDEPNDPTACSDGYTYDEDAGKCVADSTPEVNKMESPNTASPASVAAIVVGVIMVLGAVYLFLKKNNKLNFGKKN